MEKKMENEMDTHKIKGFKELNLQMLKLLLSKLKRIVFLQYCEIQKKTSARRAALPIAVIWALSQDYS